MTALPTVSTGSVWRGIWFVFSVGDDLLRVWGSALGKERIYVNETLVQEGRSFRLRSVRHVTIRDQEYEVIVSQNLAKDQLTCQLRRSDRVLAAYRATISTPILPARRHRIARVALVAALGVAFQLLLRTFLPDVAAFVAVVGAAFERFLDALPQWAVAVIAAGFVAALVSGIRITIEKVEQPVRGELAERDPLSKGRTDEREFSLRTPLM